MIRALALCLMFVSMSIAAQERDLASNKDAPERVALVIGNAAYERVEDRLINPVNDARAIAAKLRGLDIDVIEAIDLDYRGMRDALRRFDRALQGADAGLFYFAGHGMEFRGRNYLFPTDTVLETEGDVGLGLIDIAQVMQVMETNVPTRLLFLDACRNNPLARRFRGALGATRASSVGTGLARMDAGIGTFIAYATAPGQLAEDGQGEHSPFSAAMIEHLDTPGLDVSQLMRRIRNTVLQATRERQVPWESSSLRSSFVLNRKPIAPAPQVLSPSPPVDAHRAETLFWQSIESSERVAAFEAYLDRFGEDGLFAPLAKLRIEDLGAPSRIEAALAFDRREVQEALNSLGYDVGTIDDKIGPKMRMAIRLWQATHQIEPSGYLTIGQIEAIVKEAEERQIAQAPVVRQESAPVVREQPEPELEVKPIKPQNEMGPKALLEPFRDCETCPEMVVVPAGSFMMGSQEDEEGRLKSESPQHEVSFAQPFAIGRFEVTFTEWDACVAAGACRHRPDDRGLGRDRRPVISVNWGDIEEFINWLSRSAGTSYRLPSEAEWEYAARAGTRTRFWWGDEIGRSRANCGLLCEDKWEKTAPVGSFDANGFGLFDTAGNVREQVADRWHKNYDGAPTDGGPWLEGEGDPWLGNEAAIRVQRGGSWGGFASLLRSAGRSWIHENSRFNYVGFRVARTLSPAEKTRVLPAAAEKRLALSRDQRREVQFALQELGHDPRGLDGLLGPRSRAAIRAWQTASDEHATGYITKAQLTTLLDALGPRLEEFRKRHWPGDVFRDCDECPEMVVLPSGRFLMGKSYDGVWAQGSFITGETNGGAWESDEEPPHEVTIAESFAIGKYEVTFAEWDACHASGGCRHQPGDEGWGRADRPVMNVSWDDAKAYVAWLSRKTGATYRLPSEAEWEYAARAETTTLYWWGSEGREGMANCQGCGARSVKTTRVGSFPANGFGLFDVAGNLWEWVEDRWHSNYEGAPSDGRAWTQGTFPQRTIRGGSWRTDITFLRSANRNRTDPSTRESLIGFRVVRELDR